MEAPSNTVKRPRRYTDEREMPFLDHLEELRRRIFYSLLFVVLATIASLFFIDEIFAFLVAPYNDALRLAVEKQPAGAAEPSRLVFFTPTGGFMIYVKLAATAGLLFSLPFVFHQLWLFVAPGLLEQEKRFVPALVFFTVLCFGLGAAFCYFIVLKFGLGFLLSFQSADLMPMISIEEYFGFVTTLIFLTGILFEMPVIAFLLTRIGLLTPAFLRQKRPYSIIVIFVVAAVITPTVDAFTLILVAVPLLGLYEISIWISRLALPAAVRKALREAEASTS
ncbi:MAG: twin-arginine translocase subunit TatC [candidate division KSB1 bacterium]|nr:twin-arginine translocase subunit TatC [candidate division KSB1 bacterium]MDZ7275351.1 twin-arginine translocase subunit TatC [candidate division KSB1 bacterium]MDZ7287518.1 twin-arginine translocase subunit TatC [candidate division KSB1 bacterium]MDZ7299632.1 twin-arginine translocase subunit TatC [candidate division KSB1 bacterium]MDZ7307425.1 twin-arginine translocase subunit TatC [candidate division KSB1 bacterium]